MYGAPAWRVPIAIATGLSSRTGPPLPGMSGVKKDIWLCLGLMQKRVKVLKFSSQLAPAAAARLRLGSILFWHSAVLAQGFWAF